MFRNPKPRLMRALSMVTAGVLMAGTLGCGGGGSSSSTPDPLFDEAVAVQVVTTYANITHANYCDIEQLTIAMNTALATLVSSPSQTTLDDARQAWIDAREFYQQNEYTRFYGGPIDDADGPEGLMNAWPLEEAYIDYVQGGTNMPLVSNTTLLPTITPAAIEALNESNQGPDADTERNISTGWHAIEFLLWGQDLTAPGNGPGMRSFNDYVNAGGTAPNGNETRRGQYLLACGQLLLQNIQALKAEWAPGGAYRTELEGLPVADALTRIMIGMGTLAFGELRGERLVAARLAADQEEEHSCFSDTTHLDHLYDIVGIQNIWLGTYTSSSGAFDVTGTGLRALALTVAGDEETTIDQALTDAITSSNNNLVIPFEVAITSAGGSAPNLELIAREGHLNTFAEAFAALANAMGLAGVTNDQI